MRKFARALALAGAIIVAAVTPVLAQLYPAGSVQGNATASVAPPRATSLSDMFDRALCATNNALIVRLAGTWGCVTSANNGVVITSGVGVPSISSTLPSAVQDNITRLGTIASGTWNGTAITTTYIGDAQVTDAKIANRTALSVFGRSANSSGVGADIAAGNDAEVLRRSGTSIGFGTIVTAGIGDAQVTDAKIANRTALSVFGRSANSSGVGADIAAGNDAEVLRRSGTSIGFGTIVTAGIGDAQVTDAKIANRTALSVFGRSANSSGVGADIAAGNDAEVLRRSGTSIGFGTIVTAGIGDNQVTNSKLAQVGTATFKGRTTASTGNVEDLTATQATALLNNCVGDSGSGGTKGLVPAPSAGDAAAGKFLKADCTWDEPAGGGGGGGMSSDERRNFGLSLIYQSKSFAGYRRLIHLFADGYKASDGVNSGSSSNYSVDTTNGRVAPTASAGSLISQGTGSSLSNFETRLSAAYDGTTSQNASTGSVKNSAATGYIGKDYSGGAQAVSQAIIYPSNDQGFCDSQATLTLTLYAKNSSPASSTDGTVIGSLTSFSDGTVSKTIPSASTASWSYVWVTLACASADTMRVAEVEFYGLGTTNNMTLITTAQTADSSVSNGRILLEYNPVDAITLNTHLTAEVACDSGNDWTTMTLSAVGTGQSGRSVAETADTACDTSGTEFKARIKTFNNKNVQIYGITLTVNFLWLALPAFSRRRRAANDNRPKQREAA